MIFADLRCSRSPLSRPSSQRLLRGAPSGAFSSAASSRLRSWRLGVCVGCMSQTTLDVFVAHARARARASRTCRAVLIIVLVFLRILLLVRLL